MAVGRQNNELQLIITLQHRMDAVVLTLVGEIDIASVADIKATIDLIVTNDAVTAMHIDAVQVTFVDSAGVRSLLQARRAACAWVAVHSEHRTRRAGGTRHHNVGP